MPLITEWTPAELAFTYRGIKVYRSYVDDDFDRPSRWYFGWHPATSWNEDDFGVQDLPEWRGTLDIYYQEESVLVDPKIQETIEAHIDTILKDTHSTIPKPWAPYQTVA